MAQMVQIECTTSSRTLTELRLAACSTPGRACTPQAGLRSSADRAAMVDDGEKERRQEVGDDGWDHM
jgi:hypothetical protein